MHGEFAVEKKFLSRLRHMNVFIYINVVQITYTVMACVFEFAGLSVMACCM
jgi:hypothetical protein